MTGRVDLSVEGRIAILTNDNPDKHNAFDDDMDAQLFAALSQIAADPEIRAVIWRANGKSFSSSFTFTWRCAYHLPTPSTSTLGSASDSNSPVSKL